VQVDARELLRDLIEQATLGELFDLRCESNRSKMSRAAGENACTRRTGFPGCDPDPHELAMSMGEVL